MLRRPGRRQRDDGQPEAPVGPRRVQLDAGGEADQHQRREGRELAVGVDDISLRRPTLDEVFLTLTGSPIDDGDDGDGSDDETTDTTTTDTTTDAGQFAARAA